MIWHPGSKYSLQYCCLYTEVNRKKINYSESVNSNSLAFDTDSFYHKNISIVCIRNMPAKSFLFSNYVICSLDVETPYATHPLQLFALAPLDQDNCGDCDTEDNIRAVPSQQWHTETQVTLRIKYICDPGSWDIVRSHECKVEDKMSCSSTDYLIHTNSLSCHIQLSIVIMKVSTTQVPLPKTGRDQRASMVERSTEMKTPWGGW